MADPIILDTNVLKDISRGNTAVADALTRYVKSRTPVYISRAAYGHPCISRVPPTVNW